MHAWSLQLRLTLCGPVDCSPPGCLSMGFLQAGILDWVATPSSRGILLIQGSDPCLQYLLHQQAVLYHSTTWGAQYDYVYTHTSLRSSTRSWRIADMIHQTHFICLLPFLPMHPSQAPSAVCPTKAPQIWAPSLDRAWGHTRGDPARRFHPGSPSGFAPGFSRGPHLRFTLRTAKGALCRPQL